MTMSRRPAVAGAFYPSQPQTLLRQIDELLAAVEAPAGPPPKALIVPHAGYIYSGLTAAHGYAALAPLRNIVTRVVLLGPVHRVPVRGLALPGVEAFVTPLGSVPLDMEAMTRVVQLPQVVESVAAHAWEHSLEVQVPFIQCVLGNFSLVPLAVGDATPEEVAEVLECLWGGTETLIVVSSDLSHYLPYELSARADKETVRAILNLSGPLSHSQACGGTPINGLMIVARQYGLIPHLLDLRNSGDTAGGRDRVVGYGALSFTEEARNDH